MFNAHTHTYISTVHARVCIRKNIFVCSSLVRNLLHVQTLFVLDYKKVAHVQEKEFWVIERKVKQILKKSILVI